MKHLTKATLFSLSLLTTVHSAPVVVETLTGGALLGSSFGVPGNQSFDYVIVGGGTAGLALANRLSENPAFSVAVIEAGGFYEISNGNLSQIPLDVPIGTDKNTQNYNPLVDWGFVTTPQEVREISALLENRGAFSWRLELGGDSANVLRERKTPSSTMLEANVSVEALLATSWHTSAAARSPTTCGLILSGTRATNGIPSCRISRRACNSLLPIETSAQRMRRQSMISTASAMAAVRFP